MPRPEKVQAVEQIRERFDEAAATFVTEYRGLTVGEQQQLRREIRKAEGEYKVFKMSLARRAVEEMDLEGLAELLAGPTALAFADADPVPVAKALREFAKENDNLVIKGGVLGGSLLIPEQISRLAEIESREVLLGQIAGGAKAPLYKLAGMLVAMMRDAASVFSQLLEQKEQAAGAIPVEEEPTEAEVAEEPVEAEVAEEAVEAEVAEEAVEAEVAEEAVEAEVAEEPVEAEVAEEPVEAEVAEEAVEAEVAEEPVEAEAEESPKTNETAEEE